MHHPLGNPLAVELGHLLNHVVVLEQDRTAGADGERMLVGAGMPASVMVGCGLSALGGAPPSCHALLPADAVPSPGDEGIDARMRFLGDQLEHGGAGRRDPEPDGAQAVDGRLVAGVCLPANLTRSET
jgi:hypothetical protein